LNVSPKSFAEKGLIDFADFWMGIADMEIRAIMRLHHNLIAFLFQEVRIYHLLIDWLIVQFEFQWANFYQCE